MPPRPVVIVTGAGSGIGRAAAILLAKAGFNVTLAARTRSSLEETAALFDPDARSLVAPTDLTDARATRGLVPLTLAAFGRLDALANVAGHAPMCPVDELTPEVIQRCLDTNITYAINLVAAAWPTFKTQKSGVIVNVSSMASIDPFPGFSAYAPAKAAVNMFTRCIAREGKPMGIRAVGVAPGAVETPMLRGLFGTDKIPTEKTLSPQKVAAIIVGCITGTHTFTDGETIAMPSP
jgi:NAD(P)-dependent dehydrogenase (short-subunit alcohol dehydrogenase family)